MTSDKWKGAARRVKLKTQVRIQRRISRCFIGWLPNFLFGFIKKLGMLLVIEKKFLLDSSINRTKNLTLQSDKKIKNRQRTYLALASFFFSSD